MLTTLAGRLARLIRGRTAELVSRSASVIGSVDAADRFDAVIARADAATDAAQAELGRLAVAEIARARRAGDVRLVVEAFDRRVDEMIAAGLENEARDATRQLEAAKTEMSLLEAEAVDLSLARGRLEEVIDAMRARRAAYAESAARGPKDEPPPPSFADIEVEYRAALAAGAQARREVR